MNYKIILFSLVFIFFLIITSFENSFAQTGTIRGFVYEKETGEPIIFTNVYLYKTNYGAATDVNGYYAISKIPPDSYTLMVTCLGFDTLKIPVKIKANDIITKKLYLEKGVFMLETINISAEREEAKTETRTSVIKITPKQIKQIPTIGGQPDLAQYLQVIPGVIFTGDQGGQFYIRGGSPIQNKVLLDGMVIYNPFHSIGLFSVFDTDIIRNADIYTGGFGAEYGGRISSIMDITTRDGNKKRVAGKVGVSTFGAKILIEGPIKKQSENSDGSSSFILSAKNSYLEQSSKMFYTYIDENGLPFNYTDIYGKISFNSKNGGKVNFFGFNFNDKVNNYQALSDFHWKTYGGGTNFLVIPSMSPVLMEGYFAYSSYKISLKEEVSPTRTSEINGFNMGLDFTYILGKDKIKYGIEMSGFKTDYIFYNSIGLKLTQTENTTEIAAYVKYKKTIGKMLIEPSFRLQWYASLSNMSPEPRLALKYNASDYLRFKLAGGLYSQNLISAKSDRDVVNLFYGFLSGPENLPDKFNGEEITHKLQKAEHLILGVEYDVSNNLILNIEGYYKNFSQLTNINRQKLFDENKYPDKPDILTKDFIIETGDAEGIDLSLKYDYKRIYCWAVYSFAYIHRFYENIDNELVEYVPHYDRRHNINLITSYILGRNYDWEINVRWNLGSGFPVTLTKGYYPLITFNEGINTNYTTVNGNLGILYDDLNAGRLPYYHRLDISLKKKFEIGNRSKLEANISVTNVYDRKNIFYKDRVTNEIIYQLPIMPSIGLNFSFN
ncbi:MAG: TonB-dependent receptor [Bacteroidales bacterium]|nr:TonB-dependent receptor [Bacteroidales bacterium]